MLTGKQKIGYLEGWLSVFINILLFFLKFLTGSQIGSIAMVADAWHTLSDCLTSLVVIIGFWIMSKPPDEEHPFGHARSEQIASIIIGVLLAVVGVNFFRESISRLAQRQAAGFSISSIIIFSISAVFKEGLAQFAIRAGKKTNSQALLADGWHHRSDAVASLLIVVGAVFTRLLWWIDGALGIAVSLLILYAAFDILRGTSSVLLGEAPDLKMKKAIVESIHMEYPEVEDIHHLHMHRYGHNVELTVHIRLNPDMHLEEAHEVSRRIEDKLKDDLKIESTVHVEPFLNGEEKG